MSSRTSDIASIIGARPQFVKCALVSRALREAGLNEVLIHTGQHYDRSMSEVFFQDLDIPEPDVNLGVGSASHARQTAAALAGVEEVLLVRRPSLVLVYGDTNSTLAGALAAVKLGIPVAHVEAGLRSYNRAMPEEVNRVATDHWSELLFCHNELTRTRLLSEQVRGEVFVVGDVMREVLSRFAPRALAESSYPAALDLEGKPYAVLTIHRPVNSHPGALRNIFNWCLTAERPVVFPAHPRVQTEVADLLEELDPFSKRIRQIAPLGYSDMLALVARSRLVLTDSGGLQKEAFFLGIPCVTLRNETEWVETVDAGWNVLAGDRPTAAALDRAYRVVSERGLPSGSALDHKALVEHAFGPPDPTRRIVEAILRSLE